MNLYFVFDRDGVLSLKLQPGRTYSILIGLASAVCISNYLWFICLLTVSHMSKSRLQALLQDDPQTREVKVTNVLGALGQRNQETDEALEKLKEEH